MIRIHLLTYFRSALNFLKEGDLARRIVVFLFCLVLFGLALLSYFLGQGFYAYLASFSTFSQVLFKFTLLSLVSAVFLLSLVSFTISYLKTFFEDRLLLFFLTGKQSLNFAVSVFISTATFGSWPYLLISLPFFIGMLVSFQAAFLHLSFLMVILLHLLISIITASLGAIFALLLFFLFGSRLKRLFPLAVVIGLGLLFIVFTKFIFPENLPLIASQAEIVQVEKQLTLLPIASWYLPPAAFVDAFLGSRQAIALLSIESLLTVTTFLLLAKQAYRYLWQRSYQGYLIADGQSFYSAPSSLFSKEASLAFFEKEILSLARERGAFIYFAFIIFLTAIFVFFLSLTDRLDPYYIRLIPIIKLAIFFTISYLVLLFNIRFVFPCLSLETPFIWSAITSEAIRYKISWAKWVFFLFLSLVFTLILTVVVFKFSSIQIGQPETIVPLLLANTLIVTTLALSLGEIFQANLPRNDAQQISTTNEGIILTTASLLISAVFAFILFLPNSLYLSWMVFFLSIFLLVILFHLSTRVYQRSDI